MVPVFIFSAFFLHLCISSRQFAFPDLTLHCSAPVILPTCVQLFPHRFPLLLSRLHNVLLNCRDPVSGRWHSSTVRQGGGMYKHRWMMFLKLKHLDKFRAVPEQIIFQSNCVLNRNCFMSITFKQQSLHPGAERATGSFLLALQSSQKRYHFLSQGKPNSSFVQLAFPLQYIN